MRGATVQIKTVIVKLVVTARVQVPQGVPLYRAQEEVRRTVFDRLEDRQWGAGLVTTYPTTFETEVTAFWGDDRQPVCATCARWQPCGCTLCRCSACNGDRNTRPGEWPDDEDEDE